MEQDRDAWDTEPFDLEAFAPGFTPPARTAPRNGEYWPVVPARELRGAFTVRPLVSPDHTMDPRTDAVLSLMEHATDRIWAQQLDLATMGRNRLGWQQPDAWIEALATAAGQGLDVRVQLAQPFSAEDLGNREALAALEAKEPAIRTAWMERPGIATLHNKGVLVDDAVVLGSMNGNHHSRSANREVGLVLQGPGIAAFYEALMAGDASTGGAPRDWGAPAKDLQAIPATPLPILLGALGVVASVRR
jgi:phosphatidylserine/phosphatidylglycerophosphate/cardiolipin synthase-like enzyme